MSQQTSLAADNREGSAPPDLHDIPQKPGNYDRREYPVNRPSHSRKYWVARYPLLKTSLPFQTSTGVLPSRF